LEDSLDESLSLSAEARRKAEASYEKKVKEMKVRVECFCAFMLCFISPEVLDGALVEDACCICAALLCAAQEELLEQLEKIIKAALPTLPRVAQPTSVSTGSSVPMPGAAHVEYMPHASDAEMHPPPPL
jgi:hypothetical protein